MFTKSKFQYCIYNHDRLELHELQKEYQKDKAGTKLKYENKLFCPGCYKVNLVINEKKGKSIYRTILNHLIVTDVNMLWNLLRKKKGVERIL